MGQLVVVVWALAALPLCLGRYVFGLSIGGYTLSLWPFSGVGALVLCATATALLCYSFSRSFLWTFARRRKQA